MNIYQKLAKIRKPVEVLQKNKDGYGYRYVTDDVILSKITGLMDKYSISLLPRISPGTTKVDPYHTVKTRFTKDGKQYEEHINEILVTADTEWVWVNDEDPDERIVVQWTIVGQQSDASQAFGSALTYARRYFLLQYFASSTQEDDPDTFRSRQREAEHEEDRLIARRIIDQVHGIVTEHLAEHPDDRQKILEITKKYAKDKGKASPNYFVIDNPAIASELLAAVQSLLSDKQTEVKVVSKTAQADSKTEKTK